MVAGPGMDGVTGVVEHMDMRQVGRYILSTYLLPTYLLSTYLLSTSTIYLSIYYLHILSTQEETGHWDRGACPDYVDIRTEGSVVR